MIKKIFTYLQSGGFSEVKKYALIRVKKIFYYKSETIFYYLRRKHYDRSIKKPDVAFIAIDNPSDLEKVNFDRIKTLDYNRWLKRGSLAIIGLRSSRPVSFTGPIFIHIGFPVYAKLTFRTINAGQGPLS